jgi:hypothetical protein
VTSHRPVFMYTAALPLNPIYSYIFAHKIFHLKEFGVKWRKILKNYLEKWRIQAAANTAMAHGRIK